MPGSELLSIPGKVELRRSGGGAAGVSDRVAHAGGASGVATGRRSTCARGRKRSWLGGDSDCEIFWLPRDCNGGFRREIGEGARARRGRNDSPSQRKDSRLGSTTDRQ